MMRALRHLFPRTLQVALGASLCLTAAAQERVAQLSKAAGEVSITRAADGSVESARQVGPRVRGGSIFPRDQVATGADASATMVFSDGTRVDLAASTRLTVEEIDLSALVAAGREEQSIGRTIKVLAGDIYSQIADNPAIATRFETPSGVAAVKGTRISISVTPVSD